MCVRTYQRGWRLKRRIEGDIGILMLWLLGERSCRNELAYPLNIFTAELGNALQEELMLVFGPIPIYVMHVRVVRINGGKGRDLLGL